MKKADKLHRIIRNKLNSMLNEGLISEGKMVYATIVFMQNSQDFDSFRSGKLRGAEGFFEATDKQKAKFLSDWDTGEYYDTSATKPWGSRDTVVNVTVPNAGKYILTYNENMGYAALTKMVPENE